jgi:hypothetical protein
VTYRIYASFLLATWALTVSAQTPSISQVWVKPDNPVRGGAVQFVVLGDFDAKTVSATLYGPAPCDKGCELKINGDKRSDRLSGNALMPSSGEFQIQVRNGDGTLTKKVPFCTVAAPRIARIWTKPDPPEPGSSMEVGIAGAGFDSASVTAVLANSLCVQKECASISLAAKTFDYLAGSVPAVPGGRYVVVVKNANDTQLAEGDLTISPKLEQLSTVPAAPLRNVVFQFSFVGKGFWAGQSRIRLFEPSLCPKPAGCEPNGLTFSQSTATRLEGRMLIGRPGIFEVGVESAGAMSNLVKLEVK